MGVLLTTALTVGMNAQTVAILREELARLGHRDGERVQLEVLSAEGDPERLSWLARGLVARGAAVICAFGPAAVRAARSATDVMPIIALDLETDPVRAGWARSFAHPGGNVTGLFLDLSVLTGKWLELLRTAVPRARRAVVWWDATTGTAQVDAIRENARAVGVDLDVVAFSTVADMERMLSAPPPGPPDAMVLLSSPIVRNGSSDLAAYARRMHLPAISPFRPFAEFGGLMSYGPDLVDFFRRCAALVVKVLEGSKAGDVPIEQPSKFELVINLRAVKLLGLAMTSELLVRADDLIR